MGLFSAASRFRLTTGKLRTDNPSTYAQGVTVMDATTGNLWPVNGTVTTEKYSDNRCIQVLVEGKAVGEVPRVLTRTGAGASTWSEWDDSGGSFPVLLRKTGTQTKNNNTTLATITDLTFSMEANTTYEVDVALRLQAASVTPDWKFALLALPASAIARGGPITQRTEGIASWANDESAGGSAIANGIESTTWIVPSNNNEHGRLMQFTVRTAGTAGTFGLQFAQNTANASDSSVLAESLLRYQKAL